MTTFTYHLVKLSYFSALKMMFFPLKANKIKGLIYAETMSAMRLGSPIYSASRFFNREIVVFAQWDNEKAIDDFLENNSFGKKMTKGWYTKLEFIRQWGTITGFDIPKENKEHNQNENPVIAVTIARMKFLQIPRFIRWGRPVEELVRDHPGTTLSLASVRYPNIISTFSIWKTQNEMTEMVHGHSSVPQPKRHINAMKERDRKDFHFEFTTLRFIPISEHGQWNNETNFIPKNKKL